MNPGRFYQLGSNEQEINSAGGVNRFVNSISSLLFRLNYLKLYESGILPRVMGKVTNGLNLGSAPVLRIG
jgi:hypothetical protein